MKCSKILIASLFFLSIVFPFSSYAAYTGSDNPKDTGFQLVPCDGVKVKCDFNALMTLVNRFINFILYISIPLAAISFSYAGYLYLSAAGDTGKIESAHEIFKKVLIGFVFILSAWLIVYAITNSLLSSDFKNSKGNLLKNGGVGSTGGNTYGSGGSSDGFNSGNTTDNNTGDTSGQIYNNGTYNDGTNYIEGTQNPLTKPKLDTSGIGGSSSMNNGNNPNDGSNYIEGTANPLTKPQLQI